MTVEDDRRIQAASNAAQHLEPVVVVQFCLEDHHIGHAAEDGAQRIATAA
jgi:hypothetical protein